MKYKLLIAGAIILLLVLHKRKKDKQAEEKKIQMAVQENQMSPEEQLDIIRLKIDNFLRFQMPFMTQEERDYYIIDLTSNLDNYKQEIAKKDNLII